MGRDLPYGRTALMGASESTLFWLDLFAALAHAGQAVAVIGLTVGVLDKRPRGMFDGGHIGVYRVATVFSSEGKLVESRLLNSGELDIRGLIIAFFVLSAVFGLCGVFFSACEECGARAVGGGARTLWRFAEYSVSASVMLLAIACEAGVRDVYTLACQFVLTWVTMVLGVLAERGQTEAAPWGWVLPHLAGWATCLAAYVPVVDCFLLNVGLSESSPPDFVRVIVFLELVMFTCFGFVQTVGLARKGAMIQDWGTTMTLRYRTEAARVDRDSELAYTVLSLAAKSMLAWIVLSPLLAQ